MLQRASDRETRETAEARLLLHSIARLLDERLEVRRAGLLAARLLRVDGETWEPEARQLLERVGPALLPAALELHAADDVALRRWGRTVVDKLQMGDAEAALQLEDPYLLAEVLRAFARGLHFEAMPTLTRFVDSERAQLRSAARWALKQFGRDAVWQMREAYEDVTGTQADRAWSWQRTMRELCSAVDRRRHQALRPELSEGLRAHQSGDLETMRAHFDEVLQRAPRLPARARMAPGYAALAARHLDEGRAADAARLYRRALRLDDTHEQSAEWRARLALAEAKRQLREGVADLAAFERVPTSAAAHAEADATADTLSGQSARESRNRRKWAGGAAAFLLMGVGVVLAQRRRASRSC